MHAKKYLNCDHYGSHERGLWAVNSALPYFAEIRHTTTGGQHWKYNGQRASDIIINKTRLNIFKTIFPLFW